MNRRKIHCHIVNIIETYSPLYLTPSEILEEAKERGLNRQKVGFVLREMVAKRVLKRFWLYGKTYVSWQDERRLL
jgi:hypothetical protein